VALTLIHGFSQFNLLPIILIFMTPKLINHFSKKKRKTNINSPRESSRTIEDLYCYLRIGYSSDPNLLRQNPPPSLENSQVQELSNASIQPPQAPTKAPTQESAVQGAKISNDRCNHAGRMISMQTNRDA
jgi:hypothetical protein